MELVASILVMGSLLFLGLLIAAYYIYRELKEIESLLLFLLRKPQAPLKVDFPISKVNHSPSSITVFNSASKE